MSLVIGRSSSSVAFRLFRQTLFAVCLLSFLTALVPAQTTAKRALTFNDFDSWRSLQGAQISRDGKFVAYVMQPQDGDGELFVKNTGSGAEWKAPRGYRPPTPPPDPSDPAATQAFLATGRLLRPNFSADGKFLFFNIEPNKADVLKARKDKKKPEDFPKNALGIMDTATGKVTRIEAVKNYQVPEDGNGFVAILKEAAKEVPAKPESNAANANTNTNVGVQNPGANPATANSANANTNPGNTALPNASNANLYAPVPVPATALSPTSAPGKKKEYGSQLILRNLATGAEKTFADVLDYTFSKDAKTLLFAVSSKNESKNGAYSVIPQTDAAPVALLSGAGKYQKFTWDENQTQIAFISDKDDAAAKQPKFKIYHWLRNTPAATEIISPKTAGFRPEYIVSEKGSLNFSYDGTRLFTSSAPPPDAEQDPNNAVPDEEKVTVDLWHWKDDYVQPMQKVRAFADRDRSYRGVWHIKDAKFVQLADPTLENVIPSSNGLYAIGTDDRAYRIQGNYDPGYSDYYLVNTVDGSRKLLLKKARFGPSWSPNSKYVVYFDGKDWNSVSVADGKVTNLTNKLKVQFTQEDHDTPEPAPSYGLAGWTKDDKDVLIYDRFDIWQAAADGSGTKILTNGRTANTEMRYVRLDPDERFVDPAQTLLIRAESEETRDSGFYRMKIGGAPEKLVMEAKNFGTPTKAKDADTLMLTASRFDTFPDVWTTSGDFKSLKKLSDGDAQRAPFNWGHSELVSYKSANGVPLQGILIKPDNFDPNKKYPMIVYLYEKLSDTVNNFQNPGPGTSVNFSFYASNDYLVFMPDIVYKTGYPGKSALDCVLPGVKAITDKGFVNENAIGIQGHSWGGYQIAYMVTQTNRFKAAAPGALVADMFSAYNGIRWGTGLPRQFQYEHTQSRIGGTPWDSTQKFMENSPLFYVEKIQTPILMIHNDNDDAVPWYQGIEYYLSLRRLNKEVYMFNYNGEFHGLRRRANQKDYSRRMKEFFDNKLKGAPAPDWMRQGIPYLQREKEKEQYRQPIADDNKK